MGELAAVALGAGAGERLRPLTLHRPKVLCPVANLALIDHAIARVESVTSSIAVNVHHGRGAMENHLHGRVHLSLEEPEALGTAGALGLLRPWIAGRGTLVVNGDTWCPGDLTKFAAGWDHERVRILVHDDDELLASSRVAAALMPWTEVARLQAEPAGLWEVSWRDALGRGAVEVVRYDGPFVDCSTPGRYLAANLEASGGESVVGPGAVVEGELDQSVVWAGGIVRANERLVRSIRVGHRMTVLVR